MTSTCALQEYLRKAGRSIRGTALEIGLDPQLFNAYVHGKRPNQRNALKIAEGLGVAVRELWSNFDELRPY